ncbi:TIM barrel protein [Microbacterium sp. ET2]|uniref:hydroxypyruvate isomerase family protein n=1 Tax=Microbacterium albipurpureum TaxID=3050384 RepID=UPI00259CCAD5|nr:TIM barrel protein [Microbacterium sp. ET2 (Ac-2212)]WJL94943.1 TIM barrel protein [Microbacterium sp. ET2 (Ac-2212)]
MTPPQLSPADGFATRGPSSLRFDANLKWLFTELPFEERFDAAAREGFRGVEYSSPYDHNPNRLLARLHDAGLVQVLINTPSGAPGTVGRSGYACLPDHVDDFREGIRRALEYATALGSPYIHLMGGARPDHVRWDRAYAQFVANAAWAAEQAAGTDVTFLLEAQNRRDAPGFVLDSIEQAASIVEAVNNPHLGLMFDVYHCQVTQGDVVTRIRALFPLIRHVQIADPPLRSEPGSGEINWQNVFDELITLQYSGWIGCEYRPLNETATGLSWMKQYGS